MSQTARHGDIRSQRNMTLSGKLTEESPVTENVNILHGRKKMQAIVLQMKSCPKHFSSSICFLKGLSC